MRRRTGGPICQPSYPPTQLRGNIRPVTRTGGAGRHGPEGSFEIPIRDEIVAFRVHLDDCDESNGALRVVSGSHRLGRLASSAAMKERDRCGECSVAVPRGGVMVMRPLLLHASSKASNDAPRRVLHYVFGPSELPEGLRWPARKRSVANAC